MGLNRSAAVLSWFACFMCGASVCTSQTASPQKLEFGHVMRGSYLPRQVTLNISPHSLSFPSRPDPNDTCRGFNVDSVNVRSDRSVLLSVSPLTNTPGKRDGDIEILSTAADAIRIHLTAKVLGEVDVKPSHLDFGAIDSQDRPVCSVSIHGPPELDLMVPDTEFVPGIKLTVEAKRGIDEAVFVVSAEFDSTKVLQVEGIIQMKCKLPSQSDLSSLPLYVVGRVTPRIEVISNGRMRLMEAGPNKWHLPRLLFRNSHGHSIVRVSSKCFGKEYMARVVESDSTVVVIQSTDRAVVVEGFAGILTEQLSIQFEDNVVQNVDITYTSDGPTTKTSP